MQALYVSVRDQMFNVRGRMVKFASGFPKLGLPPRARRGPNPGGLSSKRDRSGSPPYGSNTARSEAHKKAKTRREGGSVPGLLNSPLRG